MSSIPPKYWSEIDLLYMEVSRQLEEFAGRLLGSPHSASDVTQEAFEAAVTACSLSARVVGVVRTGCWIG